MEPHSPKSPRYSDTPPGSPKSCMKGSRKLTFDNPEPPTGATNPSPIPSPKRSPRTPKSVSIRMHDDGSGGGDGGHRTSFDLPSTSSTAAGPSSSSSGKKSKGPPDIQFQFELTEHFDQSTPPPNCTSNGNYDFEKEQETQTSTSTTTYTSEDLRKDPQLVEIANKFVNEIIENAKVEAANRSKAEPTRAGGQGTTDRRDSFTNGLGRGAAGWYRRAHGVVSKWFTNICVRAQNIRADLK